MLLSLYFNHLSIFLFHIKCTIITNVNKSDVIQVIPVELPMFYNIGQLGCATWPM